MHQERSIGRWGCLPRQTRANTPADSRVPIGEVAGVHEPRPIAEQPVNFGHKLSAQALALPVRVHSDTTDFDGVRVPFEPGVGDEGLSVKSEQVVPVGVLAVDL